MKTITRTTIISLSVWLAAVPAPLRAADPVVANVVSAQRAGTKLVDITFEVSDADSDQLAISVEISDDSGTSFTVPVTALTGDTSVNATPAPTGYALVWDMAVDFNQQFNAAMVVRVIARDTTPPPGMVLIPSGAFDMGDGTGAGAGSSDELPVHSVTVSAFYLDKTEVTKGQWDGVKTYADGNGYGFSNPGLGQGADHPVHTVNWYDVVKWCNARSQKEGLTPVYYAEAGFATVYKTGEVAPFPNWAANGYRLPTEAEWEKAARGGLTGLNYPWGGGSNPATPDLNGGNANYSGSGDPFEPGPSPDTSPAGYYTPNNYGLHDMAGNLWEWCWDWYDGGYYAGSPVADPRGPGSSPFGARVLRGGSWSFGTSNLRCAFRNRILPVNGGSIIGFRSARGL